MTTTLKSTRLTFADQGELPLIADMAFNEMFTSSAINRSKLGIARPGIYRGFHYTIGTGLKLTIGDDSGKNTAYIERDGYCLTIQGQHPVTVTLPAGKKSAIVIEGFYQYGLKTRQVDKESNLDSATMKVIPASEVEEHHVVVYEVDVPAGAKQITDEMILEENRIAGGIDLNSHIHVNKDPHIQYAFRDRRINTAGPLRGGRDLHDDINLSIDTATTGRVGVVQLYDSSDSSSTTRAATANALKKERQRAQAVENLKYNKAGGTISGNVVVDNGTNSTLTVKTNDSGNAEIAAYGDVSGTGRVYVGQSIKHGGGIEYNGDSNPVTSDAGSDYFTLFRRNNGANHWTARNRYDSNNWEFRGALKTGSDITIGGGGSTGDRLLNIQGFNSNQIGMWATEDGNKHGAFFGYQGASNRARIAVKENGSVKEVWSANRSNGAGTWQTKQIFNVGAEFNDDVTVTGSSKFIAPTGDSHNKYHLWGTSSSFAIGMHNNMGYGWLNDHATTFTMNNDPDRGWLWRADSNTSTQGAMSLTTDGRLMVDRAIGFAGNKSRYIGSSDSGKTFKLQTAHGQVSIGADNESWAHFLTDRPGFYFDRQIHVKGGLIGSYKANDLRLHRDGAVKMTMGSTKTTSHQDTDFDGQVTFDTHNGNKPLQITRSGSPSETLSIYRTDSQAVFEITEDAAEPDSNIGTFVFMGRQETDVPAPIEFLAFNQDRFKYKGQDVFHAGYHPNADRWTTARTLTLQGDLQGSVTFDGSANMSLSAKVLDDSHDHTTLKVQDTRAGVLTPNDLPNKALTTQFTNQDGLFGGKWASKISMKGWDDNYGAWELAGGSNSTKLDGLHFRVGIGEGWDQWERVYTSRYHPVADRLTADRTISLGGDLTGSVAFDGSKNVTINATVKDDSHNHTIANVDGLQAALDSKARKHNAVLTGTVINMPQMGEGLTFKSDTSNRHGHNDIRQVNLDDANAPTDGALLFTADKANKGDGLTDILLLSANSIRAFQKITGTITKAENADKLTAARTIALGGDLTGSVAFDGSKNVTINATVKDDSHNHTIANIDGLQAALDRKFNKAGGTISGNVVVDNGTNSTLIVKANDNGTADIAAYGDNQGSGRLFVGQDKSYGGGIEYNGDGTPSTSGAANDNITLFRRTAGVNEWTATNPHNSNDWYFRGRLYSDGKHRVFNEIYHPNADKWTTARTITLGGDLAGSVSIDGSQNVTLSAQVKHDSHEHHLLKPVDDRDVKPKDVGFDNIRAYFTSRSGLNGAKDSNYQDLLVLNTYRDTSGGDINALAFDKSDHKIRHYLADHASSAWGTPEIIAYESSNVASATKLRTARAITLGGDLTGSVSFDGTKNVTISASVKNNSHTHTIGNVTGLQTALNSAESNAKAYTDSKVSELLGGAPADALDTLKELGDALLDNDSDIAAINTTLAKKLDKTGKAADSNKLDGLDSSQFLRRDINSTMNGNLTVAGKLTAGSAGFKVGEGLEIVSDDNYFPGSDYYDARIFRMLDNNNSGGNVDGGLVIEGYTPSDKIRKEVLTLRTNGEFNYLGQKVFHAGYHPNADKLTTARTISLGGDLTGSVAFDGSKNVSITAAIKDNSHAHTISNITGLQAALDRKFNKAGGTISGNVVVDNGGTSVLTVKANDNGNAEIAAYGDSQGTGRVYVGQSTSHGGGIEYNGDNTPVTAGAGSDYIALYRRSSSTNHWTARNRHDSNNWEFRGAIYAEGKRRVFHEGFHPNADKLTVARTISLGGDLTGSVAFDGSKNVTINATVKDDSHNHTIANVDGLQSALDRKLSRAGGTMSGSINLANHEIVWSENTDGAAIGFKNDSDSDSDSYMYFRTRDNGNEYFKWVHRPSGGEVEWMSLKSDGLRIQGHKAFHAGYHPNADKLTTARTITLGGDLTGSVAFDGSKNVSITASVRDNSHKHTIDNITDLADELGRIRKGIHTPNAGKTNLPVGWYTIAVNGGDRAMARFALKDSNAGDHQSIVFYAAHHYGTNDSSVITVLQHSKFSGSPFRYIRIKDADTYDGAALQVYIDDGGNNVRAYLLGDNFQSSGWRMQDFIPDETAPSHVHNWDTFKENYRVDIDLIGQGGFSAPRILEGNNRVFSAAYHPNADKLTAARTISLGNDASGSVSFDGSESVTLNANINKIGGIERSRLIYGDNKFGVNATTDLNNNRKSGFIQMSSSVSTNKPGSSTSWVWGWQTSHSSNGSSGKYGSQFVVSQDGNAYFRIQDSVGKGTWRTVLRKDVADSTYQKKTSKLTSFLGSLWDTNGGQDLECRGKRAMVGTTGSLIVNYDNDFVDVVVQSDLEVSGDLSATTIALGHKPKHSNSIGCSNWFRSSGETGWYNDTYGGGISMRDSTWVRVHGGKRFYVENTQNDAILSNGGIKANKGFYWGTQSLDSRYVKVSATNLGRTETSYITIADKGWAQPLGYSIMAKPESVGKPSGASAGYWQVTGRRDMAGGYVGLWINGYNSEDKGLWIGRASTDDENPTWEKVWTDKTMGAGSGLDADKLGGRDHTGYIEAVDDNGYPGLARSGNDENWIRTPKNGLIPWQSGGSSNLGTSSWPFNDIYAKKIYDDGELLENRYVRTKASSKVSGLITIDRAGEVLGIGDNSLDGNDAYIRMGNGSYDWHIKYVGSTAGSPGNELRFESSKTGKYWQFDHDGNFEYWNGSAKHKVWHAANDGSGSGLDADKLDGLHASSLMRSNVADDFTHTAAIGMPKGTTAQRGTAKAGKLRFNTDLAKFEGHDGTKWGAIGGGGLDWKAFSANTTAATGTGYLLTDAAATLTLPASPNNGDIIGIGIAADVTETRTLTLAHNGKKLMGLDEDFVLKSASPTILIFSYVDANLGWSIVGSFGESNAIGGLPKAEEVSYDNAASNLEATTTQGAIDEADARLEAIEGILGKFKSYKFQADNADDGDFKTKIVLGDSSVNIATIELLATTTPTTLSFNGMIRAESVNAIIPNDVPTELKWQVPVEILSALGLAGWKDSIPGVATYEPLDSSRDYGIYGMEATGDAAAGTIILRSRQQDVRASSKSLDSHTFSGEVMMRFSVTFYNPVFI